jgi:hypothetical protein
MSPATIRCTPGPYPPENAPAPEVAQFDKDEQLACPVEPSDASGRSGLRVPLDCGALALAAGAFLASVVPLPSVRAYLIFAAALLLPGTAIMTRLHLGDLLATVSLAIGLSLAIDVAAALILVWSGWYHAAVVAAGLVVLSSGMIVADLGIGISRFHTGHTTSSAPARNLEIAATRRVSARRVAWGAALLPLGGGVTLWVLSLANIDLTNLGPAGLLGVAPLTWYLALGALVGGAVWSIWATPHVGWRTGLYVAAAVLVIYGTIPALTHVPQYPWTYKHIGVINLINRLGTVSPSVDIYNRWPGVFALAASLSRVTGVDSLTYAAWVEPLFMAIDALVVAAIAYTVMRNVRIAGLSALIFVCTNWVGQTYLSPQTLAFTLELIIVLLVVGQLSTATGGRLQTWIADRSSRAFRRPQAVESVAAVATISPRVSIAAIAFLDAIIVATHQLTPYILLLQLAALVALGVTRPRWLIALLGLLTVGYSVPSLGFLQAHYGLFSGIAPLSNVTVSTGVPSHRAWLYGNVGLVLSALAWVLASLGALALMYKGRTRKATPLLALMVAPAAVLLVQSYGGEAVLRVFLFSCPWCAVLAASGLATLGSRLRLILTATVMAALVPLILVTTLGNAAVSVIPAAEVKASEHFFQYAPAGSALVLAGQDFPSHVGWRYRLMAGGFGDDSPDLFTNHPALSDHVLGSRDLPAVIADLAGITSRAFLVFSTTQLDYATLFHTTPAHSLEGLERAVAQSQDFRLWYRNSDTRIYELIGGGHAESH